MWVNVNDHKLMQIQCSTLSFNNKITSVPALIFVEELLVWSERAPVGTCCAPVCTWCAPVCTWCAPACTWCTVCSWSAPGVP